MVRSMPIPAHILASLSLCCVVGLLTWSDRVQPSIDCMSRSEGGAVGISDLRTLRQILPTSSLTPEAVGDDKWGFHKAGTGPQGGGMWLDEGGWAPLFVNGSAKDFASITNVVRASQFAQAEAYRFIYQSGRRKKPHRSLLATWT
eukprot:COSAG02_NODE_4347_length_5471_cov_2.563477_5_plen_145_part_00